jgi:hypothetical protein
MRGIAFAFSALGLALLWTASSARKNMRKLQSEESAASSTMDRVHATRVEMHARMAGPLIIMGACLVFAGAVAAIASVLS